MFLNYYCMDCHVSQSSRVTQHKDDCFVINETLGIPSMRIILDHIYHGGSLWNILPELIFDTTMKDDRIINNITDIDHIVYFMTRDFIHYCSFSEIEKVRIGFSEMLINAIEHVV